ncbi:hypothetical protein GE09DRAFT_1217895 [Coniochaeta sp. 2T2.1]|nr:hypothetical protein GE09DRAFT_1217895 [Coniochaeta sp. 2T2.1]
MVKNFLLAAALALAAVDALPDNLEARAQCNHDACFRGVITSSARIASCSSFMAVTVTPCTSTITDTATVTATTTVNNFPMKREAIAAPELPAGMVEIRQESPPACTFTTNAPTELPTYAATSCTAIGTTLPAARLSSACSCNGVTASTTTIATPTTTVTSTTTTTTTAYATPSAFILNSSGDQSLYVTVDGTGALRLTHDASQAVPFYVDNAGQLRNLRDPTRLLVDYYQPSPEADNKVYNAVPAEGANFRITCNNVGRFDGQFWGSCQASGPPNGNPVVYGFGTCPNQGYYVYMIPNNSNVRCFDGGYAFIGFFLRAYTGTA